MAIYNWWNVTRINSKASNQQRAMKHNTHNRPFIINWFKSWVLQVSDHAHAIHIRGLTTTRLYSNNTKHEPTDTMPPVLKYCLACLNINYIAQRLSTHQPRVWSLTWEGKGRGAVSAGAAVFFTAERRGRAGLWRRRAAGELAGFTVCECPKRSKTVMQYVMAHHRKGWP